MRQQTEVHVRVGGALRVGLSRHSDISVRKWSTLQERPTRVSPSKTACRSHHRTQHARTCMHMHAHPLRRPKRVFTAAICLFDIVSSGGGGGEGDQASGGKHSFTNVLVSTQPQQNTRRHCTVPSVPNCVSRLSLCA